MSPKRGALIVLEGVDRSGKSTQCRKLVESLNKRDIRSELVVFPDRSTKIGQVISKYLSDTEYKLHDKAIHMLFSANRWENVDRMKKLLFDGVTLIVDRYAYSGIAYTACKRGIDFEWCVTQDSGLPKPDRVYLLTLSEDQMKARPGFGMERYENQSMQQRVMEVYKQLMDSNWETIDAGGSIEKVHEVLLEKVVKIVEAVDGRELKTLRFERKYSENDRNIINTKS